MLSETKEVAPPIVIVPMLSETKESAPPNAVVVAAAPDQSMAVASVELKAARLRRAATALLFFSVLTSRPWPSVGWAGLLASVVILCASPNRLLCRSRVGRFFSALVILFAGIAVVNQVVAIHSGEPQRIATQVHGACLSMPRDTFEWGLKIQHEHPCLNKAVAIISRHVANDTAKLVTAATTSDAWSQQEACDKVSRLVKCMAKIMMLSSAIVHLLLLLSAMAVVKGVCCLRFTAYRCGLMPEWKKCGGCKCAAAKPAPAVTPAATMELA